jgi:NADH dehydrogenase
LASARPRVVIVGAGFGGLAAAKALANKPVDVTLIDKQNHHLFQPLLYQVATAALSPADIAQPIRSILKHARNIRVVLDCVEGIDPDAKRVTLRDCAAIEYDWLILATGARHSYFGNDQWEMDAPGLKTIDDATQLRRNVLIALERAEVETDKQKRDKLLTFIIIGGGPTGVEMAGAIAELARRSVSTEFRSITPHCSRVILVDSGSRLLKSFPETLSAEAKKALESLGVEVRLGIRISDIHDHGVMVGPDFVPASTIVWAAGVVASPAARWLGLAADAAGRVFVCPELRAPTHPEIFVVGDTAACSDGAGSILPGVAPVAKQQGRHVAMTILDSLANRPARAFRYRNYGNLATIGRKCAVADFGRLRLSGFPAWLLWGFAHVWFLLGLRNRTSVMMNWLWNYATYHRGARLITGLR